MFARFPSLAWAGLLTLGLQATQVAAISKVSAVGSKFFTDDGDQFYIKGMTGCFPLSALTNLVQVSPTS